MSKFKVGGRVLVWADIVRLSPDGEPRIRLPNHVECWIGRDVLASTEPRAPWTVLREAAEVMRQATVSTGTAAIATSALWHEADRLEAAKPKPPTPPTLREAATIGLQLSDMLKAHCENVSEHLSADDSSLADEWVARLKAALAAEDAS